MLEVAAYPAILATVLSVCGLSYLAWKNHSPAEPRTLSELAIVNTVSLAYFRIVLVTCGTLFAISMYGFVLPNVKNGGLQAAAWTMTYVPELLLTALPARGKTMRWHNLFGLLMGAGMLGSAVLFAVSLSGGYATVCTLIAGVMAGLATLTVLDRKRYIFYELPFLFLAHSTIVVAVIALS